MCVWIEQYTKKQTSVMYEIGIMALYMTHRQYVKLCRLQLKYFIVYEHIYFSSYTFVCTYA